MKHEFILWGRVDSGLRSASTYTRHGVVTMRACEEAVAAAPYCGCPLNVRQSTK
jgi:hypothetical protein